LPDYQGGASSSRWRIVGGVAAAAAVAGLVIASATGGGEPGSAPSAVSWTTVLKSTLPIEGLTDDGAGNLYVAARGSGAACPVWRVDSAGPANQSPVIVGSVAPPCSPSGLTFGPDGRLYLTGVGASGDSIGNETCRGLTPDVQFGHGLREKSVTFAAGSSANRRLRSRPANPHG